MSGTALFLVIFGILIILSRGPLILAPERTRSMYLKLFRSDRRMRVFGIVMGTAAAFVVYGFWGLTGAAPLVVFSIALFIFLIMAVWMVPFPASANRVAMKIWSAFSPAVLRVVGVVSVAFGMWLVFFGFSL